MRVWSIDSPEIIVPNELENNTKSKSLELFSTYGMMYLSLPGLTNGDGIRRCPYDALVGCRIVPAVMTRWAITRVIVIIHCT